jgi:peptidoglycan hydrolase-like protein with peptidoglycan-binding domain
VSSNSSVTSKASAASSFGQQIKAIATDLKTGSRGAGVTVLQQFLLSQNYRGPVAAGLAEAGATGYFGELTRAVLAQFQANVGISPAMGNFGPITRSYISSH